MKILRKMRCTENLSRINVLCTKLSKVAVFPNYRCLYTSNQYKSNNKTPDNMDDITSQDSEEDNTEIVRKKVYDATEHGKPLWDKGLYPSKVQYNRSDAKFSFRPPSIEPEKTSIILFPGQGTHYVGMGKRLINYPHVKRMYEAASEILGYNLYDVSVSGPKETLNKTMFQQPAIFVASLAAVEKLKQENPELIQNCIGTAGFSMGEITALTFAGSFTFEDAITVLKERAEAMQAASELTPGGMMTAFISHKTNIGIACQAAKRYLSKVMTLYNSEEIIDCRVASHLHPDCKVVAGNIKALQFLELNKESFSIERMKPLSVSGAFHTNLMRPALEPFTQALENVNISHPVIPVLRNMNNKPYYSRTNILKNLPLQMTLPVRWEQIMHTLYDRDKNAAFPKTFICGPGASLKFILANINKRAAESCTVIKC